MKSRITYETQRSDGWNVFGKHRRQALAPVFHAAVLLSPALAGSGQSAYARQSWTKTQCPRL
ncbi:hypothetical protein IWW45_003333 [Coemansia sp. RSA 485]|nr:hypothetical protein IWW45_003333 [Coemansia sp. RSA 485]